MTEIEMILAFPVGGIIKPRPINVPGDRNWMVALYGMRWRVVAIRPEAGRLIAKSISRDSANRYLDPDQWMLDEK